MLLGIIASFSLLKTMLGIILALNRTGARDLVLNPGLVDFTIMDSWSGYHQE